MRRIGDLMKELGFEKDSPVETQKAFIRHLIKAAGGTVDAPEPKAVTPMPHVPKADEPKQMSFDTDILSGEEKKVGGTK